MPELIPKVLPTPQANAKSAAAEETNKSLEAQLYKRLIASEKSVAATRAGAMGNGGTIALRRRTPSSSA
jgi:hypothetical protein